MADFKLEAWKREKLWLKVITKCSEWEGRKLRPGAAG